MGAGVGTWACPLCWRIDAVGILGLKIEGGSQFHPPASVKEVDTRILLDEKRVLLGREPRPWGIDAEPLGVTITPWPAARARDEFMRRFEEVTT